MPFASSGPKKIKSQGLQASGLYSMPLQSVGWWGIFRPHVLPCPVGEMYPRAPVPAAQPYCLRWAAQVPAWWFGLAQCPSAYPAHGDREKGTRRSQAPVAQDRVVRSSHMPVLGPPLFPPGESHTLLRQTSDIDRELCRHPWTLPCAPAFAWSCGQGPLVLSALCCPFAVLGFLPEKLS